MKVYGPYRRKDGRRHVIIIDGANRRTQSYPRYLMEQHLQRPLLESETVDHVDGDVENEKPDNFQLLTIRENIQKSHKPRQYVKFVCPVCLKESVKPLNFIKGNRKKGRTGPYCGRKCAGTASHYK